MHGCAENPSQELSAATDTETGHVSGHGLRKIGDLALKEVVPLDIIGGDGGASHQQCIESIPRRKPVASVRANHVQPDAPSLEKRAVPTEALEVAVLQSEYRQSVSFGRRPGLLAV
jgi:hypothetical protein